MNKLNYIGSYMFEHFAVIPNDILISFIGIAIQFFFLASFALLTSLGFEVQRRVKYSNRRMMYELGACYGSSLLITIITAIVEASAPLCSEIAPHFGEQHCFFHGKNFFEKVKFYI